MKIEIINTGSELLLGFVANGHQQWLCRQLADIGYTVTRQVSVSDAAGDIEQAVREALGRADLVVTTGGLGPTSDDLTRDAIARLVDAPLLEDPAVLHHIEKFFTTRGRPMPAGTRVQALVPAGAAVLMNAFGTAPGLAMDIPAARFRPGKKSASLLVMLPGPPRELHPMFMNQVVPLIRTRLAPPPDFVCTVLKTSGLGESIVEQRIAPPLQSLIEAGLEVGYCARVGEVEVRLTAHGPQAAEHVAQAEGLVKARLGSRIYGKGDDQMQTVIVDLLTKAHQTLAIAESCTGGLLSNRITNVPGASAVFLAGLVTYSNEAKQEFLGVRADTLAQHGAVSETTAREMAEGARRRSGANYALATTGIAGPGGGSPEKPVGTVFVGLATESESVAFQFLNRFDRETFKFITSQQAFDLLRRTILGQGKDAVD